MTRVQSLPPPRSVSQVLPQNECVAEAGCRAFADPLRRLPTRRDRPARDNSSPGSRQLCEHVWRICIVPEALSLRAHQILRRGQQRGREVFDSPNVGPLGRRFLARGKLMSLLSETAHPLAPTVMCTSRFSLTRGSTYAEVTFVILAWTAPTNVKRALC